MDILSVVTLTNNDEMYAGMVASLRRQAPDGSFQFLPIDADSNGWNAAEGLNHGLEQADSDWVLTVHQDVIFPEGWLSTFSRIMRDLPDDVAVLGLVGYSTRGTYVGHIRDPHGHSKWGDLPCSVVSCDEVLIGLKKSTGLRFDPENPAFLFYGTDICLTARSRGFRAMVIDAPVVHLSGGRRDTPFEAAATWLRAKWGDEYGDLIPTPTVVVGAPHPGNLIRWARLQVDRRLNAWTHRSVCSCDATESSALR
jgi:hypothetical protein